MLSQQRDLFEVPDGICYLNCSYMAPQLRSVRESGKAAIDRRSSRRRGRLHRPGAGGELWHRDGGGNFAVWSGRSQYCCWRANIRFNMTLPLQEPEAPAA
jgi:hypothetical protein